MKKNLLKNSAVQTLVASLICIVLGLFLIDTDVCGPGIHNRCIHYHTGELLFPDEFLQHFIFFGHAIDHNARDTL